MNDHIKNAVGAQSIKHQQTFLSFIVENHLKFVKYCKIGDLVWANCHSKCSKLNNTTISFTKHAMVLREEGSLKDGGVIK